MNKPVELKHVVLVYTARKHMLACAALLKNEGYLPRCFEESIDKDLDEENRRIQGNRPGEMEVTWEDLRLQFLSSLKYARVFVEQE